MASMSLYTNFLFFFLLPVVSSLSFNIPHFDANAKDILLEGDAVVSGGTIELINKVNYIGRVGRATYAEGVPIWDSATGKLTDFTTHFSFSIFTRNRSSYGHGLAFFIAPVGFQIPPNSVGGFLGLFNTTTIDTTSLNQIIMVEFDSYSNPEWDPPGEHVGINKNTIASAVFAPWNASLHSDETCNARITYNSTTKILSVFWTYDKNHISRRNSHLSYTVDLRLVLPERVTIGFSAATGQYAARHVLESWEFSSSLHIEGTERKKKNK